MASSGFGCLPKDSVWILQKFLDLKEISALDVCCRVLHLRVRELPPSVLWTKCTRPWLLEDEKCYKGVLEAQFHLCQICLISQVIKNQKTCRWCQKKPLVQDPEAVSVSFRQARKACAYFEEACAYEEANKSPDAIGLSRSLMWTQVKQLWRQVQDNNLPMDQKLQLFIEEKWKLQAISEARKKQRANLWKEVPFANKHNVNWLIETHTSEEYDPVSKTARVWYKRKHELVYGLRALLKKNNTHQ